MTSKFKRIFLFLLITDITMCLALADSEGSWKADDCCIMGRWRTPNWPGCRFLHLLCQHSARLQSNLAVNNGYKTQFCKKKNS